MKLKFAQEKLFFDRQFIYFSVPAIMSDRKLVDLEEVLDMGPFFLFLRYSMDSYAEMEAIFGKGAGHLWQRYAGHMFDMTAWFYSLDKSNQCKVVEWYNGERLKTGPATPIRECDAAQFAQVGQVHVNHLQRIVNNYKADAEEAAKKKRRLE